MQTWRKRIIDVYLSKQVLYPFLVGVIIIGIIMISGFLFDIADLIIVKDAPVVDVMKILFYRIPQLIVETIPLAILFAVMTGMGRLSRQNEFTALRMGGVSLFRLIIPLVLLGLLISGLTLFLNENVVPWANHRSQNLIRRTSLREKMPDVQEEEYFRGPQDMLYFVDEYDDASRELKNIVVFNKERSTDFPEIITAETGRIEGNLWVMEEGLIHKYRDDGKLAFESQFENMEIEFDRDPVEFFGNQKGTSEMSRSQLREEIEVFRGSGIKVDSLLVEYHLKLSQPLAAFIFILIGTPLSLAQKNNRITSIILTIAIIFLYYVLLALFRSLGRNGVLSPVVAAWATTIIFAVVGVVLLVWRESWRNFLHRILPGLFTVLALLLIFFPAPAQAAESDRVEMEGEYIHYNRENNMVVMNKNVNGRFKQFYFQAQEIEIKLEEEGEGLGSSEEIKMAPGNFTGCDLDEPHYVFNSRKVVIYPGDHLEAHHVFLMEFDGQVPVFYWPYLYLSLDDEEDDFTFEFGYDNQRGFFVKSMYNYRFAEEYPGELYLDYYTRTGWGGGFQQHFAHSEKEEGYVSYYRQQNKIDLSRLYNWQGEFMYRNEFENWNTDSYVNYEEYDDRGELEGNIDIEQLSEEQQQFDLNSDFERKHYFGDQDRSWTELALDMEYEREIISDMVWYLDLNRDIDLEAEGMTTESDLNTHLDYEFLEDWELFLEYNYEDLQEPGEDIQDTWDGEGVLTYERGDFTYELLMEREGPSLHEDNDISVTSYKLPEMTVYYQPEGSFDYMVQGGKYLEEDTEMENSRGSARVNFDESWQLRESTKFNSTQMFQGFVYNEPRHTLGVFENKLQLKEELSKKWTFENTYQFVHTRGETPFEFDEVSEKNEINSELEYDHELVDFTLEGGYDYSDSEYLMLVPGLDLYPTDEITLSAETEYDPNQREFSDDLELSSNYKSDKWTFSAATDYDLEGQEFTDVLDVSSNYRGERLTASTGIDYDLQEKMIKVFDNELTYEVSGDYGWYLKNNIEYDFDKPEEERLRRANLVLEKDLHCRSLDFSYDHVNRNFMVTYRLDLFPEQGVTVERGEDESYGLELGDEEVVPN
ncbi:MAG: LptF/LptG family permease [Halanaerobiales bacterium]